MVETLHKRKEMLNDFIKSRTLIIADEAHIENFTKIFPLISLDSYVIGATATPYRKSNQNCLSEFYQTLVQEVDTPELIKLGYLSDAITYSVDIDLDGLKKNGTDYDTSKYYTDNKIYTGVVNNYLKYSNGKALLFASNVENSIKVCEELNLAGIESKHVDGKDKEEIRESIFNWFRKTKKGVLCNCGIATTGYNQHDIDTIILYRATTSLPLFLQMCGRGSRITESKKTFKILDFGNNVKRLGFWQEPRTWSLEKQPKRLKNKQPAPMTECDFCGALIYLASPFCPYCSTKKEKFTEVESVILRRLEYNERHAIIRGLASDVKAKRIRYKTAVSKLKGREEFELFGRCMGYKKGWAWNQLNNMR
jgi:superfamily II DNA or RNA helicase